MRAICIRRDPQDGAKYKDKTKVKGRGRKRGTTKNRRKGKRGKTKQLYGALSQLAFAI